MGSETMNRESVIQNRANKRTVEGEKDFAITSSARVGEILI